MPTTRPQSQADKVEPDKLINTDRHFLIESMGDVSPYLANETHDGSEKDEGDEGDEGREEQNADDAELDTNKRTRKPAAKVKGAKGHKRKAVDSSDDASDPSKPTSNRRSKKGWETTNTRPRGSAIMEDPLANQSHFTDQGVALPTPGTLLGAIGPPVADAFDPTSDRELELPAAVYLAHIQGQATAQQLLKQMRIVAEMSRNMALTSRVPILTPEADSVLDPAYAGEPLMVAYKSIALGHGDSAGASANPDQFANPDMPDKPA